MPLEHRCVTPLQEREYISVDLYRAGVARAFTLFSRAAFASVNGVSLRAWMPALRAASLRVFLAASSSIFAKEHSSI
jgi:hypothetical protein